MQNNNYETWEEIKDNLNISEKLNAEIKFEEEIILAIIEARKRNNISQRELSELSGIKQPAIARIEKHLHSPNVNTLLQLLYPMGYTLKVVPLNKIKK